MPIFSLIIIIIWTKLSMSLFLRFFITLFKIKFIFSYTTSLIFKLVYIYYISFFPFFDTINIILFFLIFWLVFTITFIIVSRIIFNRIIYKSVVNIYIFFSLSSIYATVFKINTTFFYLFISFYFLHQILVSIISRTHKFPYYFIFFSFFFLIFLISLIFFFQFFTFTVNQIIVHRIINAQFRLRIILIVIYTFV